jgi:phytoene dehydrogenase-like protein
MPRKRPLRAVAFDRFGRALSPPLERPYRKARAQRATKRPRDRHPLHGILAALVAHARALGQPVTPEYRPRGGKGEFKVRRLPNTNLRLARTLQRQEARLLRIFRRLDDKHPEFRRLLQDLGASLMGGIMAFAALLTEIDATAPRRRR